MTAIGTYLREITQALNDLPQRIAAEYQSEVDRQRDETTKALRSGELERLREIEWLARDFIWSYPETIDHPTYVALANAFDNEKKS